MEIKLVKKKNNRGKNAKNAEGFGKLYRVDCVICGKPMWVIRAIFIIGRKKTCSKNCASKNQSINNKKRKKLGAEIVEIKDQVAFIKLRNSTRIALVDKDDIPKVENMNWVAHNNHSSRGVIGNIYANSTQVQGRKRGLMHRIIMGAGKTEMVDHINGDGLDNRKENLRIATGSENMHNMHKYSQKNCNGFIGVAKVKSSGKFYAQIKIESKVYYLGTFDTPEKAHKRYVEEKRKLIPQKIYG